MTKAFAPFGPMKAAVLFLVFNRPETTGRVFEAIRKAKPPRLYVAADGPRKGRDGEVGRVVKTRKIATDIDWPCEVRTLFRAENLGCKQAVSSAISWFFEHEEAGIILEDDCVPHADFFGFCNHLLDRYATDERIFVITGDNFQDGQQRGDGHYYFSKYNHCWGWASWRRAWKYYQGDISFWPEWKQSSAWLQICPDVVERRYWEKIFNQVYLNKIDSWAYPWAASVWKQGGLTATPNVNLVCNIGFGLDATHTKHINHKHANLSVCCIESVNHPEFVEQNSEADAYAFNSHYDGRSYRFPRNVILFIRRMLGFLYRKAKSALVM